MYQFTEDCRIGIPEIDEEHKNFFQMVNEAFALLAEPSATVVGVKIWYWHLKSMRLHILSMKRHIWMRSKTRNCQDRKRA